MYWWHGSTSSVYGTVKVRWHPFLKSFSLAHFPFFPYDCPTAEWCCNDDRPFSLLFSAFRNEIIPGFQMSGTCIWLHMYTYLHLRKSSRTNGVGVVLGQQAYISALTRMVLLLASVMLAVRSLVDTICGLLPRTFSLLALTFCFLPVLRYLPSHPTAFCFPPGGPAGHVSCAGDDWGHAAHLQICGRDVSSPAQQPKPLSQRMQHARICTAPHQKTLSRSSGVLAAPADESALLGQGFQKRFEKMRSSACSASASLAPVERLTFSEALGRPSTSAASWITPRCQRRTWGLLVVALPALALCKLDKHALLLSLCSPEDLRRIQDVAFSMDGTHEAEHQVSA